MGLINLKTDLKNLKYGKDRKGGGSSGQPYIKSDIPDGLTSSSPDFLLRNGYLNPVSTATDVSRLTQMFFDLKTPNGLLFIAKQNLLSKTAVKTQTTNGNINDGVYTPLSTLAQSGVISVGGHLNKQGTNPFTQTGAYANNNDLYATKIKNYNNEWLVSPDGSLKNRLFALYESKIQNNEIGGFNKVNSISTLPSEILSYPGGPGSNLGIGNTNIKFSDQRTGINNPLYVSNPSYFTGSYKPIFEPGNYLKNIYSDTNNGVSGKYQISTGISLTSPYNPQGVLYGVYNFNVYDPLQWPKNSPLINENNTFTYTQDDINTSLPNQFNPSPKSQDFRAILRENLKSTDKEKATKSGATPFSPSYDIGKNKTIEGRNLLGNPGNKEGKNLSSYTNGSGIGPIDKINALPIYRSEWVTQEDDLKNDLVKFRIAAIDNDNPNWKNFMHFRAFLDSFSDSYTGEWSSTKYLGRGENFYNYTGFNRTISLSWTVAAQSKEELIPMYKKLNYLASNLMPDYSKSGYMRGPLMQLTIGGYLYEQVGFFTSLTYDIPQESPWEIGINDVGGEDSLVKELPHIIKVQASYTPIHDFVPSKQDITFIDQYDVFDKNANKIIKTPGFANTYGKQRFIALSVGNGSQFNNYDTAEAYNIGNNKYKVT